MHSPESLGDRAAQLPGIYAALGLAPPMPDTVMRQDEERVIADFLELWSLLDDRPEVYLRAARIAGDGVRRIQGATLDLFDELGGPPGYQLAKGKSPAEAMRPALRLGPVLAELMVWLQARHQEHEVFGRIVTYVEETLIQAGRGERHGQQPAIAFIDLTGYTEMTASAGDERAAQSATMLQTLAASAVRSRRGRVVKLLGDGVMLRYSSMVDAIDSVRELMASIAAAGLPPAHAGIAAGADDRPRRRRLRTHGEPRGPDRGPRRSRRTVGRRGRRGRVRRADRLELEDAGSAASRASPTPSACCVSASTERPRTDVDRE